MQLGSEQIVVPFAELGGDPTSFDPAWRAKVASVLASGFDEKKVPKQLKDKHVLDHAKFLKEFKGNGKLDAVYAKYPLNGLVMNWAAEANGSKSKQYLEALLLTDQPISVVAADLQLEEPVVKLYCNLYFACRSEKDGYEMKLPVETRLAFAFGEISHDAKQLPCAASWRVLAVRGGYSALVRHWGVERLAHGKVDSGLEAVDRNMSLASTNIENQLRTGGVGLKSLVEFQNSWLGYKKMQNESEASEGVNSPVWTFLTGILAVLQPSLEQPAAQAKAEAKSAKKKQQAAKNIEAEPADKNEALANAEFNKIKIKKFKSIDANVGRPK